VPVAGDAGVGAEVKIDIKEFMFDPKDLTVAVGTKVTWVNDDQVPHTVAETHKVFRSGAGHGR
jgi:plastocyanin